MVVGDAIGPDYCIDETLKARPVVPAVVVLPSTTAEVAAVVQVAAEFAVAVTAGGAGTGLSGACIPLLGGMVMSFERMSRVAARSTTGHVAIVQPGVTLAQLDAETAKHGLVYPVFPGTNAASLGGNVGDQRGRNACGEVRRHAPTRCWVSKQSRAPARSFVRAVGT